MTMRITHAETLQTFDTGVRRLWKKHQNKNKIKKSRQRMGKTMTGAWILLQSLTGTLTAIRCKRHQGRDHYYTFLPIIPL